MTGKRALLLVGSPKGVERSLSGRLGAVALNALAARGFTTDKFHVHAALRSSEELVRGLAAVAQADLVILALPLYVDSFPSPVIALLEKIAAHSEAGPRIHAEKQFALLIQCGFPEDDQNATAVRIAKRFALEVGWQWLGALSLGGLQTLRGLPEEALTRAAQELASGRTIPPIYVKEAMPSWLYRLGGNFMWRRVAAKNGAVGTLRARPYAK